MFSFHKPKIYRSNLGCCICKAKSSSSRFTDSKKYENEFERCFRIQEKRSGEICNACVLLVKRWKKLSPENRSLKHWHHVVDARAGPGTKLTSNRRLTGPSYQQLQRGACSSEAGASTSSAGQQAAQQSRQRQAGAKSEVLPLSSSQANNQASGSTPSGAHKARSSSFSKARAIDTNVSTFTFGEPLSSASSAGLYRRSYASQEPAPSSYLSGSSVAKPQSALNSSAFESVIKRFRQRQQQQQLERQRRQQRSQQQRHAPPSSGQKRVLSEAPNGALQEAKEELLATSNRLEPTAAAAAAKRTKRCSESIGALTVDGQRVGALLDQALWRKEKLCCGLIFRGLHNELAVFPKLLKPCQWRCETKLKQLAASSAQTKAQRSEPLEAAAEWPQPPARAEKSGSISSCDSSTSGTGSMELAAGAGQLELEAAKQNQRAQRQAAKQRRKSNLRQLSQLIEAAHQEESSHQEKQQACGASAQQTTRPKRPAAAAASQQIARSPSSSSSSGASSSRSPRILLMAEAHNAALERHLEELVNDDDDQDDEEPDEALDEEESTTDASSSTGSFSVAGARKKAASSVKVVGAFG